jgi:hypothetical protein
MKRFERKTIFPSGKASISYLDEKQRSASVIVVESNNGVSRIRLIKHFYGNNAIEYYIEDKNLISWDEETELSKTYTKPQAVVDKFYFYTNAIGISKSQKLALVNKCKETKSPLK